MKTIPLILIGIVFALGLIGTALACECKGSSIEEKIENVDVIFSGKLGEDIEEFSVYQITGNFAIKKIWKGAESFPQIQTGDVKVVTGSDGGLCGLKFVPNKDYLIFAHIEDEHLTTSPCYGSGFLDGKSKQVQVLDEMGSTHTFIDAREIKTKNSECGGPGLTSKEQCEYDKLVLEIIIPIVIALSIAGVAVFIIWRKRI